eukprot:TRINITY_DN8775_c0_g1_i1.p1 TRINITY_DN8775_c0_g1~~TRINITY_DN8775_c0_g1_i1.p1  ORF type:complete len:662 (-),score=227.27 TRINITY_DN8775_c0_g1_i1:124-2109(-)
MKNPSTDFSFDNSLDNFNSSYNTNSYDSEYSDSLGYSKSFIPIKTKSTTNLKESLEMNNKKRYFELLVCENLWMRSKRDMKTFREELLKIKNHNLLPEFPDEILEYSDKDLKEYIKKYFIIGSPSPIINKQDEQHYQIEDDNSLDDLFERNDQNKQITTLYKERLNFDILPFKVSFPRYQLDFVELCKIGSGGFANVYKAKHILDERLYAIKKIFFLEKFLPSLNKVVREVKTLAKLNHKRIVRYYNAWIEKIEDVNQFPEENVIVEENSENLESDTSGSMFDTPKAIMKYNGKNQRNFKNSRSDTQKTKYLYVLYIQMEMCDNSLRNWLDERKEINEAKNLDLMNQLLAAVDHIHENNIMHRDLKPSNCFIQFRSPKNDPSSHSNNSNTNSTSPNNSTSSSSLDTSPSFPFYSTSPLHFSGSIPPPNTNPNLQKIEIKIGDFGLSKEILDHNQHLVTSLDGFDVERSFRDLHMLNLSRDPTSQEDFNNEDLEHTSNLGTECYIAPELSSQSYGQKSDVYSLGIIFFELYNIFSTKMDRNIKIKNLSKRILPTEMLEKYPRASAIILSMISFDPKDRKSVSEIFDDELFKKKDSLDDKNIILMQTTTIKNLSLQNLELESKVLKLKNKIRELKKQNSLNSSFSNSNSASNSTNNSPLQTNK